MYMGDCFRSVMNCSRDYLGKGPGGPLSTGMPIFPFWRECVIEVTAVSEFTLAWCVLRMQPLSQVHAGTMSP